VAKSLQAGSPRHLALHHFEPRHLAFYLAIAPRQGARRANSGLLLCEAGGNRLESREAAPLACLQPCLESVDLAPPHERQQLLGQGVGGFAGGGLPELRAQGLSLLLQSCRVAEEQPDERAGRWESVRRGGQSAEV
jgi:hypothetical protein